MTAYLSRLLGQGRPVGIRPRPRSRYEPDPATSFGLRPADFGRDGFGDAHADEIIATEPTADVLTDAEPTGTSTTSARTRSGRVQADVPRPLPPAHTGPANLAPHAPSATGAAAPHRDDARSGTESTAASIERSAIAKAIGLTADARPGGHESDSADRESDSPRPPESHRAPATPRPSSPESATSGPRIRLHDTTDDAAIDNRPPSSARFGDGARPPVVDIAPDTPRHDSAGNLQVSPQVPRFVDSALRRAIVDAIAEPDRAETNEVTVYIERIDVRAAKADSGPPAPPHQATAAPTSLESYLRARSRRAR